jgi:hypothetical protein
MVLLGLTSVELATGKTVFYGKDLNHVRGWYFWLRRQLGLKKAIDTIKKIGDHEKRIANDIIHKITREIVNRAIETDSLIILGKLNLLIACRIQDLLCAASISNSTCRFALKNRTVFIKMIHIAFCRMFRISIF